ncbi:AraC family transcriptional regulator, partial [Streptomyces coelicoflavus]|nr:AraC family transcriptional regulator [Streptomyces coelicoflavus]
PQGDRQPDPDPAGASRPLPPSEPPTALPPETAVPFQTRRTATPMPAGAAGVPGQRSAP